MPAAGRLCAPTTPRVSMRLAKGRGRRSETEPTAARRYREWSTHPRRLAIAGVPSRTPPSWIYRGVGIVMGRPWASAQSLRVRSSVPWRACALRLPTSKTRRPSAPRTGVARHPGVSPLRFLSGIRMGPACANRKRLSSRFTCKWAFFGEPTSGLEPLTCSLRVIGHTLQEFARACKCRINRRLSLLRVATRCTVLRPRWCQSGINITLSNA